MITHRSKPLYPVILIALFLLTAKTSGAQSLSQPVYASNSFNNTNADASVVKPADISTEVNTSKKNVLKLGSIAEQRRLMGYLKALKVNEDQQQALPNKKFYYNLANVFAKLRLYPLAMKCFLKAAPQNNQQAITTKSLTADAMEIDTAALAANSNDDDIVASQAQSSTTGNAKSIATTYPKIQTVFNDGKPAAAYAMLFHVKQPVPGKRKIFVWGNTGHTFITLIKYNKDSTYVSASFGFYPKKDQLLSATPLVPTTSSTFKDDAGHGWDEVIGKFISKHKFEKILKLTKDFDGISYNLNNRNCTDFGLQAAGLAGITIQDTAGKWPLGKGNNPAVTGQSLLAGKVSDTDSELFKTDQVKK